MSDVVIAIPILAALLGPFLHFKLYRTAGLLVVIIAYEGIVSWMGESISQEWWRVSLTHSWGWLGFMLGLLAVAWAGLLWHLAWKKLKHRR